MADGHGYEQPEHPQTADKEHGDQRRHADIAAATQRTGQHLNAYVGDVDRRQDVHHADTDGDHRVVLAEQAEQHLRQIVKCKADDQRRTRGHCQTDPHAAAHAVILPCAEVLPRKRRDGDAQRVDRHPEQKVDLAVDAPRRNRAGAEAVHAALDEHIADVVHGALGGGGHADGADGRENVAVQPQLFGADVPRHPLRADDAAQRQHRAGHLTEHRCQRRAHDAPAEHCNEHDVQHNVDERRRDQEVQRTLGITDGTQDIGAHVVEHLRDHAQKVDAQIQRCVGQNLVRRAQQTHYRRGGHKAQHSQQCANGSAQHQRRVHLPVHGIGVMCAPALGNDDARAAAKPDEQAHQQVDEGPCCAHRGQRVCAHKVTDDQGVRRVVQLLEQRAEPDGQKEQEQLFGDAARQNIRLFDAFHRISLTFLFLATTFYAIMALM